MPRKSMTDSQLKRMLRDMRKSAYEAKAAKLTDARLRTWWRANGGSFHGPNVETGTMPEATLLPLLRRVLASVS